jgi:hypothetical protein
MLTISAPENTITQLGDELESALPPSTWTRDRAREKAMQGSGYSNTVVFVRHEDDEQPSVSLSLVLSGGTASVGNIVPINYGQLSRAQYNAVLEDFITSGVQPLAQKLGLTVNATKASRPLTDWLSDSAAQKLKQFSAAANKSSGASHPADNQRWLEFIIQTHVDGCTLDASTLRRWLREVEHWPEEEAYDLASRYDFGRDLLKKFSAFGE